MVIHYVIRHSNGASIVLGLVIAHIHRGVYISLHTYIMNNLWISGLLLYMLLMEISVFRISISMGTDVGSGEVQL